MSGFISINGRERDEKKFRRQSAYIMQDHELQPMLTVLEAMYFSVNLKIGEELTQENKQKRVSNIVLEFEILTKPNHMIVFRSKNY